MEARFGFERGLPQPAPEVWGGVECTLNRVGDRWFDQLELSGHRTRAADLDLFADLGFRVLRYPLLWESIAPHGLATADWSWADARMERLRQLKIRPIVGLLHHGSGPAGLDLANPEFPAAFAAFAGAVARRYPWVSAYTPINEPLTTARFSGLYGHWYPHRRDDPSFCKMLLLQCQAVALAMREIRRVNPEAQLVQTEDGGKTFSTPAMERQAQFDNQRRWLGFDLLAGRVDVQHPLWEYLGERGRLAERGLLALCDRPCPPDVVGLNYYVTSDRYLDERLELFPPTSWGTNGQECYADAEAVRSRPAGIGGSEQLLREAWARYQLPVALTEVQIGCGEEEQLRWLAEAWHASARVADAGIPVRAMTIWSLLGSFFWDELVTVNNGTYESGVFSTRSGTPEPTAVAALAAGLLTEPLAALDPRKHPGLAGPGWWRKQSRLNCGPGLPRLRPRVDARRKAG